MRAVVLGLSLLAGSAAACEGDLAFALFLRTVPEARVVFDAEAAAVGAGALPARARPEGATLHEWRLEGVVDATLALDGALDRVGAAPIALGVMFVEHMSWSRIELSPAGAVSAIDAGRPDVDAPRLYATATVALALAEGRMSFPAAEARGLVALAGPRTDAARAALTAAFPPAVL